MKKLLLLVPVFLIVTGPGWAQSDEDRLRAQLRDTVLQLRALQDNQAALQARATAAEQERDALRAQLAKLQADVKGAEAGRAELQQGLTKYRDAYSQASQQEQQSEAARTQLQTQFTNTSAVLDACMEKNTKLIALANEILDAYQHFDILDAVGANEPFIGIHRVDLENLAQGYGDRIYDGKFDPKSVSLPVQAPATPAGQSQPAPSPN